MCIRDRANAGRDDDHVLADDLAHDLRFGGRADDAVDPGGAGLLGAQAHELSLIHI